ncbi:hypothetical protein VNO77_17777 [Canavalia gladiata]|uniref:Uncharacterized protein n=1 Tax=Canavalia gladiata TaxID=3824 RepID=A0AAN9LJN9_CANGL
MLVRQVLFEDNNPESEKPKFWTCWIKDRKVQAVPKVASLLTPEENLDQHAEMVFPLLVEYDNILFSPLPVKYEDCLFGKDTNALSMPCSIIFRAGFTWFMPQNLFFKFYVAARDNMPYSLSTNIFLDHFHYTHHY